MVEYNERSSKTTPAALRHQASKYLIINADGLGFTAGINRGIIETFRYGLVRSTSCLANFGHLEELGALQQRFPGIAFGVHFNLSVGMPLCPPAQVPTLVGADGRFFGRRLLQRLLAGRVRPADMHRELTAQAAAVEGQAGPLSHWDGHQNKHLYPLFFEVACRVAKHFAIPAVRCHRRALFTNTGLLSRSAMLHYYVRHPQRLCSHACARLRTIQARSHHFATAQRLITPGYADASSKAIAAFWYSLAEHLPGGISEVYCHPGYVDDELRSQAQYLHGRPQETKILSDPHLLEAFNRNNVQLINFNQLKERYPT